MKRVLRRALVESALLAVAFLIGFAAWVTVAFSRDNYTDNYWSANGHPPAIAPLSPLIMPLLMFGPPLIVGLVRARRTVRSRRS